MEIGYPPPVSVCAWVGCVKVLITGATGFVGGHLTRRTLEAEHTVRCLVRTPAKAAHLHEMGAMLVRGDVTDKQSVVAAAQGCDWIFHLAGVNTHWQPDTRIYRDVHLRGTRNVMEAALDVDALKVVHMSTALVYGRPAAVPFTEESRPGPVRFTEYARTKYMADQIAWNLHERRGLPLIVVYPGGVLGPGDGKQAGQHIMRLIQGKMPVSVFEDSVTTLVHVSDVAEIVLRAAAREDCTGEKFLAGNARVTIGQLNEMVCEIAGVAPPRIRLPDAATLAASRAVTAVADVTKYLPFEGIAYDSVRTMHAGLCFDGSKARRKLGIEYTPLRVALEEEVASLRPRVPAGRSGR